MSIEISYTPRATFTPTPYMEQFLRDLASLTRANRNLKEVYVSREVWKILDIEASSRCWLGGAYPSDQPIGVMMLGGVNVKKEG